MNQLEGGIDPPLSLAQGSSGKAALEEVKAAFFEYNCGVRITNTKIAFILVMILLPVGVSLDYFVYPELCGFFFVLRLICAVVAGACWRVLGTDFGRRHFRFFCMGSFVLPSFFIDMMIYYSEGARSPYYAGLNLLLIGISWIAQVDFVESLIASGLTLVMYETACLLHGSGTTSEYFNNFYFLTLNAVIVCTGCYFLHKLRFSEFALRAELDSNQKELKDSNAKLVELDRAKSMFFANVSHELRTPLTLLIAPLEQLRHKNVPSNGQMEMLDIMYNNAMRLLRLINDLLDLVRLDSGAIRVRREKIEVYPFLEGIAKSVSPMAQQRKLNLETHIRITKDAVIHLDKDKLEKIILNLLFNSFKFTPENGKVTFEAGLQGNRLIIRVSDTGKGISNTDLPQIFNRFWQAEAAATRQYQGVGIGLALVKELAEAHGGGVCVESEVGKGTMIQITVDTRAVEAEPEEVQETKPVKPPQRESEWLSDLYRRAELFPAHVIASDEPKAPADDVQSDKPLVLVADDEPEMRRFLHSQLKNTYAIKEARNGSEALELAKTNDFALILLDLMMPGIDGITLTGLLREEPRNASVPIIMLTARADEGSKMQALQAGVTDFLTKPFASSELEVRCRNLLNQRELQQSLIIKTRELEAALQQITDTEAQLVHQAKMASLGQLSSGLMHEINNPLNFANTAAHLLGKRLNNLQIENKDKLDVPLRDLQDGIKRVADIISSLRSFIHPDTSNFNGVLLKEAIEASARFVQIPPSEVELEIAVPDNLKIWGNRNQLIHLFINLLQNAVDSLRDKGAPEKKIKFEAVLQNGQILLICEDNGKGIKKQEKEKVFDAFFTTKPVGSGMGLGLNIGYRIIKNHQGEIRVESQENEFCRFLITLHPTNPSPKHPSL